MKTVKGKFIGQTSCGFTSGIVYELTLFTDEKWLWVVNKQGRGACPYTSLEALARNWEIPVKKLSKK